MIAWTGERDTPVTIYTWARRQRAIRYLNVELSATPKLALSKKNPAR
ncbi:hypothetical protein ACNKHK_20955 [Shigella flexneri]